MLACADICRATDSERLCRELPAGIAADRGMHFPCPIRKKRAGTLKSSYSFIRYIPVAIVMSVSHVSGYAMIWMDKGSEISQIEKSVCGMFYLLGERKIPGYNCQFASDKAITGNRYHDTPVRS